MSFGIRWTKCYHRLRFTSPTKMKMGVKFRPKLKVYTCLYSNLMSCSCDDKWIVIRREIKLLIEIPVQSSQYSTIQTIVTIQVQGDPWTVIRSLNFDFRVFHRTDRAPSFLFKFIIRRIVLLLEFFINTADE